MPSVTEGIFPENPFNPFPFSRPENFSPREGEASPISVPIFPAASEFPMSKVPYCPYWELSSAAHTGYGFLQIPLPSQSSTVIAIRLPLKIAFAFFLSIAIPHFFLILISRLPAYLVNFILPGVGK